MGFQCRYCDSILSTKENRSRHEHKFHPDEIGLPVYQCSLCEFTCRKISLLEEHMKTAHQRFTNCCQSCLLGFNDCHLYVPHMTSVHHLPVLGEQFQPRDTPLESAFHGVLRSFESTAAEESNDLENFMRIQKPKIDTLISEHLTQGPQKVQLCAKLRLVKVMYDEPDMPEDDRIEIYANSLMTPVYANGLSDEAYWQMVENMMSVLTTFNSLGSGWTLEKVLKVDVKFASFRPILGSSYIAFPSKIANCRGFLNVRNHEDQDCFRYCFVAAYHMYHQISLDRIDRNCQTDKASPTTYNQPGLHQPLGDFTMPMGFAEILQFERLNNVQVNVFGYDNGQFFPLKISSYSSDFVMDLLLLYDCDRHHYVLITNLVKVVCYVRGLDYRFS